jgi:hypothetical protein
MNRLGDLPPGTLFLAGDRVLRVVGRATGRTVCKDMSVSFTTDDREMIFDNALKVGDTLTYSQMVEHEGARALAEIKERL